MRILIIDTYPVRRGAQIFVSDLASALSNTGHDCNIIYLYSEIGYGSRLTSKVDTFCFHENPKDLTEKIPGFNFRLLFKIRKYIRNYNPEVILLNGSRTLKYGAILRYLTDKNLKWIYRVIDDASYWNSSFFSNFLYKHFIISNFDGAIGVSRHSLNAMIAHYNFKKPTNAIHRAFDFNKFSESLSKLNSRRLLGLNDNDEVLLFIGNISSQKRLDRFLEISMRLKSKRPSLVALIIGDGPDLLKYKSTIDIHDWISFHGYQENVGLYLAASDIHILCSDTEGLPGVVLEAAFFNVPTLASNVGGVSECIIDGQTGYLVDKDKVDEFVNLADILFSDPELIEIIGRKANDFIRNNFRMELTAKSYLKFFEDVFKTNN
ncbi:glycosyltransferase family 4 protein [Belliella kenyensis]|uniref:Glycosyltransferase family 4 protein n=1 Tax=Belliella kenyensis TaxID=1472724 RepID=A0ABV8EPU9_9BACT|nr:glycosyltransferase family 4 protein [Belliella kenyensis]MCH7402089.1 glycosyltransferase family 4 protein [Belliella kenyensis]MDN3601531.1 glycosyltransferase family 4 protein [Belliella kenyensis]MDN3605253.1 glycosyltransferase family 4 protein [Belliella kenyensis]